MTRRLTFVLATTVLLADASLALAQTDDSDLMAWLHGGLGVGSIGPGATVGAVLQYKPVVLSARWAGQSDMQFFACQSSANEWAVMLGLGNRNDKIKFHLGAGYGEVRRRVEPQLLGALFEFCGAEQGHAYAGGVAAEAGLYVALGPVVGVGLYGYTQTSNEDVFSGVALSLRIVPLR